MNRLGRICVFPRLTPMHKLDLMKSLFWQTALEQWISSEGNQPRSQGPAPGEGRKGRSETLEKGIKNTFK